MKQLITVFRVAIMCPACGRVDPPVRTSHVRKSDRTKIEHRTCACGCKFRVIVEVPTEQDFV